MYKISFLFWRKIKDKKILASLMLFIICISSSSYALEYVIPVWLDTGGTREVSNEALRRKFFEY